MENQDCYNHIKQEWPLESREGKSFEKLVQAENEKI